MATLNLQVSHGDDDGDEIATGDVNKDRLSLPNVDTSGEWFYFRWQNVTIPQGATISSAVMQFYVSGTTQDEPLHNIDFENVDAAAAIVNGAATFTISGRSYTGSPVLWDNPDIGVAGAQFTSTPDLSVPLQIVINRPGWASGNALGLYVRQPTTDATRDLGTVYYETDPAVAAKLDIEYVTAAGPGSATGLVSA